MSDTMPERVIIEQNDGMLYAWYDEGQCATPENYYVSEQRALNAEHNFGVEHDEVRRLTAERDALQADLKALRQRALEAERERDWLIECINAGGHRCSSGSVARTYPALLCSGCRSSYDKAVVHFVNGERMKEMDADFKALLPLARFALYLIDTAAYDQYEDWIHQKAYALGLEEPGTTKDVPVVLAARAILDREGV